MSKSSDIKKYYTARGYVRYEIEVSHEELNKYQLIKGDDIDVIQKKLK
jgi:hypothetical protein